MISSFSPLWSKNTFCIISIPLYLSRFYSLAYGLSWRMFNVHLRRMYILLPVGIVFYRCLLDPIVLVLLVFWFHFLLVVSIFESRVLNSPNIIHFSLRFYFCFGALLGTCMLITVRASQWTDRFIIMKCPSLITFLFYSLFYSGILVKSLSFLRVAVYLFLSNLFVFFNLKCFVDIGYLDLFF